MQNRIVIYLSIGSNIGERMLNIVKARGLISNQLGVVQSVSSTYETGAWGYTSVNRYYNICLSLSTTLSPQNVLSEIKSIEVSMGRVRDNSGYSDRIIDIDLLFYGNEVIEIPGLKVPHPRLGERKFVLVPLLEIAPDLVHPQFQLTIREMAEQCKDNSDISSV